MEQLATAARPLRIAIIGAGPGGLYAAEALLKQRAMVLTVEIFNRFPTPFGLVRDGVAPDHQAIKAVIRVFDKVLADPRVRFFGNVTYGVARGAELTVYHKFSRVIAKPVARPKKDFDLSRLLFGMCSSSSFSTSLSRHFTSYTKVVIKSQGAEQGCPRVKVTTTSEMMAIIHQARENSAVT